MELLLNSDKRQIKTQKIEKKTVNDEYQKNRFFHDSAKNISFSKEETKPRDIERQHNNLNLKFDTKDNIPMTQRLPHKDINDSGFKINYVEPNKKFILNW